MTPQPSEQPTTGTPCQLCGGVMFPGHHCRATNPILHWPNDPRIPRCNENCHRAEREAAAPDPAPCPPEALRLLDQLVQKMETFARARRRDADENRDPPDNINGAVAAVVGAWVEQARRFLKGAEDG